MVGELAVLASLVAMLWPSQWHFAQERNKPARTRHLVLTSRAAAARTAADTGVIEPPRDCPLALDQ
jgi:hypothetical protein